MHVHIITIGKPKLGYAQAGWAEYLKRLQHYHTVRITHLADKFAYDDKALLQAAGNAFKVGLAIEGKAFDSPALAAFLEQRALDGQETCFMVGGPEGLPPTILRACDFQWSLSPLTFPHDLAMVILAEALYRASTINAGQPYHK